MISVAHRINPMSGENEPSARLFDLDALDQDSEYAARAALEAEYQRIAALPDHAVALAYNTPLIQELDTRDLPLELKAADYLSQQALEIAVKVHEDPASIAERSLEFAARFYGTSDTNNETIWAAFQTYNGYLYTLYWASGNGTTIGQARQTIEEFRAQPKPKFVVNPNLKERPLRSADPFQAAFENDDFQILDDDAQE